MKSTGMMPPLDEITRRLASELEPDRIILFGSHAWGTPDADSDLDLLVIVPESDQPPTLRAVRAHRCLRGIPFPIDVLVKTRAEVERGNQVPASLVNEVLRRGRVLYS